MHYIGRFAPSPTGALHLGSLVTALASYLDARAHSGKWLVRIEDIDQARSRPDYAHFQLQQLHALGLHHDDTVTYQSQSLDYYEQAWQQLKNQQLIYPCSCSRKNWQVHARINEQHEFIYPGLCRHKPQDSNFIPHECAWRIQVGSHENAFMDRHYGLQRQSLQQDCGDFIIKRRHNEWAYQLAVVVDDARQGVTHIVRGADLLAQSHRQHFLQDCLNYKRPSYLHVPLVCNERGQKLSKQTQAEAINIETPLVSLKQAWQQLEMPPIIHANINSFLQHATQLWANKWVR